MISSENGRCKDRTNHGRMAKKARECFIPLVLIPFRLSLGSARRLLRKDAGTVVWHDVACYDESLWFPRSVHLQGYNRCLMPQNYLRGRGSITRPASFPRLSNSTDKFFRTIPSIPTPGAFSESCVKNSVGSERRK